jgi:hypothetical protein
MKNQKCKNCGETTKDSLAEDLNLCQECWEDECDKDWWREVRKLKVKNNMGYQKTLWFLIGAIVTLIITRNIRFF